MFKLQELTELIRVLQDPTRLRLLAGLRQGELTVGEIVRVTGLSQPRVSRHLKLLCDARVVRRTPDQNEVYYRAAMDDDRRGLVGDVLSSLSEDDPAIARDRQRLTAILDGRQTRARALLARLGVRPLDARDSSRVSAAVDALLAQRLPHAANGVQLGEMLTAILDGRQTRARALLARLGVRPLDARDSSRVSAAVDALLAQRLPHAANGVQLGEMLDIGTGTGSMLRLLANRARRTVAVDQSRDMRLVARATVLSFGLANCTVRKGDMYDLEFPDGRFDLVIMDRVLGTAAAPAAALGEAARVMKDRGHLLIVEAAGGLAGEATLTGHLRHAGLSPLGLQAAARQTALVALAAKTAASRQSPR